MQLRIQHRFLIKLISLTSLWTLTVHGEMPSDQTALFAGSLQLSQNSDPVVQRAGDILFKQYVEKYGSPEPSAFAPNLASTGGSELSSLVSSLMSNLRQAAQPFERKNTEESPQASGEDKAQSQVQEVQTAAHSEKRENEAKEVVEPAPGLEEYREKVQSPPTDEKEALAQKLAEAIRAQLFKGYEGMGGVVISRGAKSQVTPEQINQVEEKIRAREIATNLEGSTKNEVGQLDSAVLESMGIQKLGRGISIFRLARYRFSNLKSELK